MYITNTTENVIKLIEEVEQLEDLSKLNFITYIFGLLNNNQINYKNEANPDLVEDDDINILNMESLDLPYNYCTTLLQYLAMLHNTFTTSNDVYEDNGNVIGIKYNDLEKQLLSKFEKLKYNEKLDVISELVIRYDNETYFKNKITKMNFAFDLKSNGFELARKIQNCKL